MSIGFLLIGLIFVAARLIIISGWVDCNKKTIAIMAGIITVLLGIIIIIIVMITGRNEKTYDEIQTELESEAIENYDNGSEVYINGKENDVIGINGIALDN